MLHHQAPHDHLEMTCAFCGSNQFTIPSDPNSFDLIVCATCGGGIRHHDLLAAARPSIPAHEATPSFKPTDARLTQR